MGYRRVALEPHEVLTAVSIPFTRRHEYVREFKQAHRRDDDIAIVNAGMRVRMRRTLAGALTNRVVCSATGSRSPSAMPAWPHVVAATIRTAMVAAS